MKTPMPSTLFRVNTIKKTNKTDKKENKNNDF